MLIVLSISERMVKSLRLLEFSSISRELTLPALYIAATRSLNWPIVSAISSSEASSFMVSSLMLAFSSSISFLAVRIWSSSTSICFCRVS